MPFTISNQIFDDVFKDPKSRQEMAEKFLAELDSYLSRQTGRSSQMLLQHMRSGGEMSVFTCREDLVPALISELRRRQIPFLMITSENGNRGFVIRDSDRLQQRKAVKTLLKEESMFCRFTTSEIAKNTYMKSNEPNKTMIEICGLTEAEMLYLKEACKKALAGEVAGIDRMEDGTTSFWCPGMSALKPHALYFPQAVSEAFLVVNGNDSSRVRQRLAEHREYAELKANGFLPAGESARPDVWVVGDGNRYVRVTDNGFELGHATETPLDIELEMDMAVPESNDRYNERLNSALCNILNKKCLYSEDDAKEHFRTKRPYFMSVARAGEQILIEQANDMIRKKIMKDSIMHAEGRWQYKLIHYQKEMGKLLIAARDKKVPKGYNKDQILQLRKICRTFGLDLQKLTPVIEKVMSLEVYARDPGKGRIKDVDKLIAHYRGTEEKSDREQGIVRRPGDEAR